MKRITGLDKDYVEILVALKHSTEKAYLVEYAGTEVWIPKSQIEGFDLIDDDLYELVIPEWLAIAKELV